MSRLPPAFRAKYSAELLGASVWILRFRAAEETQPDQCDWKLRNSPGNKFSLFNPLEIPYDPYVRRKCQYASFTLWSTRCGTHVVSFGINEVRGVPGSKVFRRGRADGYC